MLQNEREFQNTKLQLGKMEQALEQAQSKLAPRDDLPEVMRQGHLNGITAIISDKRAEVTEYEALQSGQVRALPMQSVLAELPATLVRARIARGWTHKELAQALGTSEQQVQKDESGGYAKARLDKLNRVAGALGVSLSGRARLSRPLKVRVPKPVAGKPITAPRPKTRG